MSEFDREERAFRAALLEHAEQVPTDSIRFEPPRRRTAWLPVAAVAAVVVLIVGLVVALRPDSAPAPPQPAGPTPSATTAPTEAEESNAAPAEDPADVLADGTAEDVAVTPGDRDSRAVLWRKNRRTVVAVTHDGFATRELHEFRGWWTLEPAGAGRFLVVSGDQKAKIRMLESDGGPIEIAVSGDEYPAQAGEVLVRSGVGQESGVIAVNPASGEAHRVPVPSDVPSWSVFGGRITGVAYGSGSSSSQYPYHWSDDGGRTWQSATLSAEGASALWHVAASPKGGPHRVVEGAMVPRCSRSLRCTNSLPAIPSLAPRMTTAASSPRFRRRSYGVTKPACSSTSAIGEPTRPVSTATGPLVSSASRPTRPTSSRRRWWA